MEAVKFDSAFTFKYSPRPYTKAAEYIDHVAEDEKHSEIERRYYALGHTDGGRSLFVVFTIRGDLIRVISARDMNRRERRLYDGKKEEGSEVQE